MKYAFAFMMLASPAWAECGGYEQTFLHCQIEKSSKTLSVCFDDEFASYRFGPKSGAPELEIVTPIATLKYTPWPGAGDTIFEEIQFVNLDHTYTVVAAIKRIFPEDPNDPIGEVAFGGLLAHRISKEVADLSCDPAHIAVGAMGGLALEKSLLGYSWNVSDQDWVELPD